MTPTPVAVDYALACFLSARVASWLAVKRVPIWRVGGRRCARSTRGAVASRRRAAGSRRRTGAFRTTAKGDRRRRCPPAPAHTRIRPSTPACARAWLGLMLVTFNGTPGTVRWPTSSTSSGSRSDVNLVHLVFAQRSTRAANRRSLDFVTIWLDANGAPCDPGILFVLAHSVVMPAARSRAFPWARAFSAGKRRTMPALALLNHQVGIGDDETAALHHRSQLSRRKPKGHGFRSLKAYSQNSVGPTRIRRGRRPSSVIE